MYKIGEVSNIAKISTRMLRYYDKENILKPSYIGDNGYRYYTDENISIISKIKNLRRYEFSYEEIKEILDNNRYESMDIYINKIEELKKNINKYGCLISELEEKNKMKEMNVIINNYDVNVCENKSVKALCKGATIDCEEIEQFIESSYSIISKNKVTKLGAYYVMFCENENLDENICEIEYYQPIVSHKEIDGFDTKIVERNTYISTTHYGPYERLSDAYSSLYKWSKNNNYEIKGNFMEKYFVDSSFTSYSYEFITEVSVKVSKI
ncbi:MerR family transcriptional regulator [Romboutsia weinsteinii]|uniref:MerR family transcriptional regulator n=1 Tax=Romboutsia weinsteinii TaxID=2020949 RepID=A0A371IZP5_9FIRM|nr:MerR family transcriptional regulator [Romboutsia weinsteinii]RDY25979.1 MerR family transcriptional regulator [Romboutsia weinsteinii]